MLALVYSPALAISGVRRRKNHVAMSPACSSLPEMKMRPAAGEQKEEVPRSPEQFPAIREAKRVVLVRHGQSTWNEEGRIQGSSDHSVLTTKGESQAATSRQMLLSDSFDVCFTSPLIRSKRTAEIIWANRAEEMIPDSDLREIDLYSFQGLLKNEGKERYGSLYRQWQKDAPNFNIDGHYPVRELWERACNCWDRILAHEAKSVLVVAHNAVNQALVATALGLSTQYFRILLQSNCGVSVLDFTPNMKGGAPNICLNRLNQTPNSPVSAGSPGGRKTKKRIILVCQGATNSQMAIPGLGYEQLNMLGVIQSQKTAELLLDLKVNRILSSPRIAAVDTATNISEVQEAADCLGADCVPRYVEFKKMLDLEVEPIFQQVGKNTIQSTSSESGWLNRLDEQVLHELWNKSVNAWQVVLHELSDDSAPETNLVVVGHPAIHLGLICQCLHLSLKNLPYFHLNSGSVSVIDFPDGAAGRGVVRCTNYTAHLGRWSIPITRPTIDDENF